MREIKKKLKPYYDDKHRTLNIEQFLLFEMALAIVVSVKQDADPAKGYLIFTKYQNIGKRTETPDAYIIQNASICLKKFRSEKIWRDTLKEYKKEEYAGIRLFEFCEDKVQKRDTSNLAYPSREEDYMNYIFSYSSQKSAKYAVRGVYSYYNKNNEEKMVYINLNESMDEMISPKQKEVIPRQKIVLDISSLYKAAEKIQTILPEDPCLHILRKNIIREVNGGKVKLAEALELNKVVHIVGMVGAGKTTLLKTMTYALEQLGKRVVVVTDTVAQVFQLYRYFHALGCNCSPLIGKKERIRYINQIMRGDEYYLDEVLSNYLTTNCLIDGMDLANENAVSFGEEPCTALERGGQKYVCPYFQQCPTTSMQREAFERNVVITTVAGLAMSRVGQQKEIFLKEVIETADVVFYDECDRVQKNLDELFAPATEFNAFINACAEDYHQFMLDSNAKRMENMAGMYYAELQAKSPIVLACVSNAVKAVKNNGSNRLLSDTFSAYTLLDSIKEEISDNTFQEIYQLMDFHNAELSSLYDIMLCACESIKTDRFEQLLSVWIDKNEPELKLEDLCSRLEKNLEKTETERKKIQKQIKQKNERTIGLRKRIQLIITLICFDKFIMDIGDAYEDAQDSTMGRHALVDYLRTTFSAQQEYLPSALMGNLFGIKSAKDDDILLFRQYAYGRALLTDLPYLRVNKEGKALGPHIVLLSGSSYAKGSFEYHVNAEVNYIIEAGKSVRDFISKTRFAELGFEERVSGSPLDKREEILKKVVGKCTWNIISELKREGKILFVVNSLLQAESVAAHLRANLRRAGCMEEVCALVSDKNVEKGESDHYIRRGEVYKFDKHKARILVAPALAIERGHNIVDEQGHSSLSSIFFLIRPMGVPDDVKEKSVKMNGYIATKMSQYKGTDLYEKNSYVRREASKFWIRMNDSSKRRLDHVSDTEIKTDLVATMFVLILQIFGRLCRVTDDTKHPPAVYFVDGAFRKRADTAEGFDTLNELYVYLKDMLSDTEYGAIARALYEPFFTAFKGGITYEQPYNDLSNGVCSQP